MRHLVGWVPPPRPYQIVPSIDASEDARTQIRNVLVDFAHAPAIWGWVNKYSQLFADDPHPEELNPQDLVALFFAMADNPAHRGYDDAAYQKAKLRWTGQLMIPFDPNAGWTAEQLQYRQGDQIASLHWPDGSTPQQVYGDFDAAPWTLTHLVPEGVFQELDQAVMAEVAQRLQTGPLPSNSYADPVSIYYYDEGYLKRVDYPHADLYSALDPTNLQWWRTGGVGTWQSTDGGQTWGPEGFSWDKDVAGNVAKITSTVLGAVSSILALTGVGAAAGVALAGLSAGISAWANVVDQSFIGGDVAGAMGAFLQAFATLASKTGVGKLLNLNQAKTAQMLSVLAKLVPAIQTTQAASMTFPQAYAFIQAQVGKGQALDAEQMAVLETALGPVAAKVFNAGVLVAQYATPEDVEGVTSVLMSSVPIDTASVFKMGAILGRLQYDAAGLGALPPSPFLLRTPVQLRARGIVPAAFLLDPRRQLMTYVVTVLKPRYHL